MIKQVVKYGFLRKPATPIDLIVHVTSNCNAKCETCFVWETLNSKEDGLTLAEYDRIARQLPEVLNLNISGGEPFLRDDLPEICETFYRNSNLKVLGIPTNGLLPERIYESSRKILERVHIPVVVDISIDGLYERHDQIRGVKGNFDKAIKTYQKLLSLKQEFPNLFIKVITVINNKNYDQLEEIDRFVKTEMKEVSYHSYIFLRGSSPCASMRLPDLELLKKKKEFLAQCSTDHHSLEGLNWIERKMAFLARRYLLDINFQTLFQKDQVVPCLAGKLHCVISANGDVSFCEIMHKLGNLREHGFDFNSLWQSKLAGQLRQFVKDKKCHCTHECVQMVNIVFNPRVYLSLARVFIKDKLRRRRIPCPA